MRTLVSLLVFRPAAAAVDPVVDVAGVAPLELTVASLAPLAYAGIALLWVVGVRAAMGRLRG